MTLISPKGLIDFSLLENITKKPELFAKDDGNFWQDPYISEHLLNAHLDDESDQGSRKYQDILQSVLWLCEYLKLPEDSKLLDLGCGPGLYSENFYGQGFNVTGIDFSQSSIDYAKEQADGFQYKIEYICQNYLEINYKEEFDVITLIYGDLCVLSHTDRALLLRKVKRALKPGGYLIFDVFTKHYFKNKEPDQSWYISEDEGFWSEKEHLLLQSHYKYKKDKVRLDKYTMILKNGEVRTHNIWKHYFSLKRSISIMEENGFSVKDYWSNLQGKAFEEKSSWIGMVAQKPE
ncbi:MAG: class I SAM-dependent methyltransferase [Labilibaculum sp.]|nr:class I SAM-dependent methyltransferase [Labilibaculum sp.]